MGNHDAGRSMVQTACALDDQRARTGQSALEILDIACGPYRDTDAEFDDERQPETQFGKLLIEAFAPQGTYDSSLDNDYQDQWWDEVVVPFKERYQLW